MTSILLVTAVALGLLLRVLMWASQRALLERDVLEPAFDSRPGSPAPVSVLRPLKGLDPGLEANLKSLFRLDYPVYEVLLGVEDLQDPAVEVARRVARAHPAVPSTVVADARKVGCNPKVNNLANLARHARHERLLVSDSNVALPRHYLRDLAAHLDRPGVRLVTSPIRAVGFSGLGGWLESLQLNSFVMPGVAAANLALRTPCVVGKSMLFARTELERLGGFAFLGRFLAEDQVAGEEVARRGGRIALSSVPVNNVLGRLRVVDFVRRHLRWALIRSRVCPAGYAGEILLEPVALAVAGLVLAPDLRSAMLAAGALALVSSLACAGERRLGVARPLLAYPALELLRSVLVLALWPVALFRSTVAWRGNVFKVGMRTRLRPAGAAAARRVSDEPVLAAHA